MLRLFWMTVPLAAAALVAAGCGDSDKPAYCSNVSDLQESVDAVKNVQLTDSGSLSTLQTALKDVQSDADAVVSSAKEDFPTETSALTSSVSSLSTAVEQVPPSPTAQQLAPLALLVSNVATAATGLESATKSACD